MIFRRIAVPALALTGFGGVLIRQPPNGPTPWEPRSGAS